jgi:hypothetical protein
MDVHDLLPVYHTEEPQQIKQPTKQAQHIRDTHVVSYMDVHDLLPLYNTEVQQQLQPSSQPPPAQYIDRDTTLVASHSIPLPMRRWPNNQKLQDCSSYGDKFIYVFTCCNFRFKPGCDERGFCYCCGNDYSYLGDRWCSLLSPSICCCCPCILTVWANGCCYKTQQCCRGDPAH